MKTSEKGLNIIKKYESCRLSAYLDPVGIPTIGWGHTSGVRMGQTITQAQADAYLAQDIGAAERAVSRYDGMYHWNQNRFDALVSFTYNCGSGNLDKLLKNGKRTVSEVSAKLPSYCRAGGRALPGLVKRRAEEKALFDAASGSTQGTIPSTTPDAPLKAGDIVTFTGKMHYTSSGSPAGKPCRPGSARVTQVYKPGTSRHPYHLVGVPGGSNVHGWVDAADVRETDGVKTPTNFKAGDIVAFSGKMHYNSSYAGAKGLSCTPGKAMVTAVNAGKAHPYHLVHVEKGCTVYGWVDEKDVRR